MNLGVDPEKPLVETQFKVRPSEPFAPHGNGRQESENGRTLEHITFWDPQSDVWIERDACRVDRHCHGRQSSRQENQRVRLFYRHDRKRRSQGARASTHGKEFRIDVYNLEEEQRGFHRGCDEDEIWFQFRGHSLNHTEWGAMELDAGQTAMIPRGIAHRITGSPGFLRMVFYSRGLVQPKAFNNISERETRFEVQ